MNQPTASSPYLLEAAGVSKSFKKSGGDVRVLSGAGLTLSPGETVSLTGASGCGKSTFLHIIGLLETPDAGEVIINGERLAHAGEAKRSSARRRYLGFVYQFHGLLGDFTALENVALPFAVAGKVTSELKERAEYLLQLMDVYHRRNHTATELSGGEQQRVAVARALARFPSVLLADEPTGNLDEETAGRVMEALMAYCEERSAGLVCVTHHPALAGMCSSKYVLRGGAAHRKT